MSDRPSPNIVIEKLNLERVRELYEVTRESGKEWFAEGMILKPELSLEEVEAAIKALMEEWENDAGYWFYIVDASTDQLVGLVFLNRINRTHQLANLGYVVRTSRARQGIATAAARLAAQYGFENLGLQRIEIVVRPDNPASLRVAEKAGAVREALLRNRLRHHESPCDAYMHSLIPSDLGIDKAS